MHCGYQTNTICLKFEVPLCCHSTINCFLPYHTEENNQIVCLPSWLKPLLNLSQSESDLDDPESDPDDPENTQENMENTHENI